MSSVHSSHGVHDSRQRHTRAELLYSRSAQSRSRCVSGGAAGRATAGSRRSAQEGAQELIIEHRPTIAARVFYLARYAYYGCGWLYNTILR